MEREKGKRREEKSPASSGNQTRELSIRSPTSYHLGQARATHRVLISESGVFLFLFQLVLLQSHQLPASLDQDQQEGRHDEQGGRGSGQSDGQQQVRIPGCGIEYLIKVILNQKKSFF